MQGFNGPDHSIFNGYDQNVKSHITILEFSLWLNTGLVKLWFSILRWSLLSSFSQWCPITAMRPSKWMVLIMSGYQDFQCPSSNDLEKSDLPMAYLPPSFCRSDGCRPFGKFEWDPTVTGSLSSFFLCNARVFFKVVPPKLLLPNPQGVLSFLSCCLYCCH